VRPETLAAAALHGIDPTTGAVIPPLHLATTYARLEDYSLRGPCYGRADNPTLVHAERVVAELEGGVAALSFASGMAAATACVRALVRPGAHVIGPRVGYFNFRGWLERFCRKWNLALDVVDMTDLTAVRAAMRPETALVWAETPANPTWEVADIAGLAAITQGTGAKLVIDSTCATPVHTRPLSLGADIVMHSATKYLGGHSDLLAGMLVTRSLDGAWQDITGTRYDEGCMLGPFDAFLLLRGIRTLFARVERQSATALILAERLAALPGLTVRYPGLASHPQHALAARQMTGGFGGMFSLQTGGGPARALAVLGKLRHWLPATSLGGVESLVEHRYSVEGATTPTPDDLLRLSVGLEHVDDLYEDLREALS